MELAELDLQVALLSHFQRVRHRLRDFGEARLHLFRRPQVELLLCVSHPLRVRKLRLRADADQAIVRVRVGLLHIMHVVGGDALQTELFRPRDEVLVHLRLLWQRVVLQLQVEIFRAERLLEPVHRVASLVQLVLEDRLRDFAGEAAGKDDQTLLVRGEQFLVNARLVVIAIEVRGGGELDEVLVAGLVLRQQDEVVIDVASAAAAAGLLLQPAARRHIHLAADDRLDALGAGGLVEINRAVKHAVVRDGQRGEAQLVRPVNEPVQPASAVQQRVLGVQMEVNKISVRHRGQLTAWQRGGARRGCSPTAMGYLRSARG